MSSAQDDQGIRIVRKRGGDRAYVTTTVNFPGVDVVDAETGEVLEDNPRKRARVNFTGDASELVYKPDLLTITRDGIKVNDDRGNKYKIGEIEGAISGVESNPVPPQEEGEPEGSRWGNVNEARDGAISWLQQDIDRMMNRFYVFAGGDFGENRTGTFQFFGNLTEFNAHEPKPESIGPDGEFVDVPNGWEKGIYSMKMDYDIPSGGGFFNMIFQPGEWQDGEIINSDGNPDTAVDLSKNRRLHFRAWADPPTEVMIIVGNQNDSTDGRLETTLQLDSTPTEYEWDAQEDYDLSAVNTLFMVEIVTTADDDAKAGSVFVDEIYYERTDAEDENDTMFSGCWVKSWGTPNPQFEFDVIFQNISFTYDQTLSIFALLAAGDIRRARYLMKALNFAVEKDMNFSDGRVRNGYRCGPSDPFNSTFPDAAALPGWEPREALTDDGSDTIMVGDPGTYGQDQYTVGTWIGTAGWAHMTLVAWAKQFLNDEESENRDQAQLALENAKALGSYIEGFRKDDEWGGFEGGVFGGFESFSDAPEANADGQLLQTWRSTEHAADLVASYQVLYELTRDYRWADLSRHAMEFIDKMWFSGPYDGSIENISNFTGYWTGTDPPDPETGEIVINKANIPLDPTLWVIYGADRVDSIRVSGLQWMSDNCREEGGNPLSLPKYSLAAQGGWIEGAGQMAVAYKAYGLNSWQLGCLTAALPFQLDNGSFLSVTEDSDTGFNLPGPELSQSRWQYYRKQHTGATAWFCIGAFGRNPFRMPSDQMGMSVTGIYGLPENVNIENDLTVGNDINVQNDINYRDMIRLRTEGTIVPEFYVIDKRNGMEFVRYRGQTEDNDATVRFGNQNFSEDDRNKTDVTIFGSLTVNGDARLDGVFKPKIDKRGEDFSLIVFRYRATESSDGSILNTRSYATNVNDDKVEVMPAGTQPANANRIEGKFRVGRPNADSPGLIGLLFPSNIDGENFIVHTRPSERNRALFLASFSSSNTSHIVQVRKPDDTPSEIAGIDFIVQRIFFD